MNIGRLSIWKGDIYYADHRIFKREKGRYYAVLNLYDSTGKRIQKSHATGLPVKNNKRKAEQILKQLCVEYDNKNLNFYSNIKVADYFKKWLVAIKSEVRPNTYRSYKGNMETTLSLTLKSWVLSFKS